MDVIYRYDPFAPITPRQVPDPAAAVEMLLRGNERFAELIRRMQERTLGGGAGEPIIVPVCPVAKGLPLYEGAMPTQAPFAVVLGCSDARVPTEAVFDQSFNDLFVLRIAGNVLGSECLGSLHYALRHLGDSLKLIVVLGHSKCGAVTAAVDTYLSPEDFADIAYTFPLRSLVDQIQIAVRGSARALEKNIRVPINDQSMQRSLLVATAVYVNAAISALELQRELRIHNNGPKVVFGVYDFETLRVQGCPAEKGEPPNLREAPQDADAVVAYAAEVVEALMSLEDDTLDGCRLTMQW